MRVDGILSAGSGVAATGLAAVLLAASASPASAETDQFFSGQVSCPSGESLKFTTENGKVLPTPQCTSGPVFTFMCDDGKAIVGFQNGEPVCEDVDGGGGGGARVTRTFTFATDGFSTPDHGNCTEVSGETVTDPNGFRCIEYNAFITTLKRNTPIGSKGELAERVPDSLVPDFALTGSIGNGVEIHRGSAGSCNPQNSNRGVKTWELNLKFTRPANSSQPLGDASTWTFKDVTKTCILNPSINK